MIEYVEWRAGRGSWSMFQVVKYRLWAGITGVLVWYLQESFGFGLGNLD